MMQKTEKSLLLPEFETRFRGPHYSSTYDTDATLTSLTVVDGSSVGTHGGHIKVLAGSSCFHDLLQDFPIIFRPASILRETRHFTVHHICTTPGQPVILHLRRLAPDRLRIAKSEFEKIFRTAALGLPKARGLRPATPSPRKKTAGDPVATIVH
jgi:hypothetical protein